MVEFEKCLDRRITSPGSFIRDLVLTRHYSRYSNYNLQRQLCSLRAKSLHLSPLIQLNRWPASSTHCLDVEKSSYRYLLSGFNDGSIAIYDLDVFSQTPRKTCPIIASVNRNSTRAHRSSCTWIEWHPSDTGLFTSAGRDHVLKIWDTNAMKPVEKFDFDQPLFQHSLSPSCSSKNCIVAVASGSNNIQLVDLLSGCKLQQLRGHYASAVGVCWSPVETHILFSSGQDGQIIAWDVRSSKSCLTRLVSFDCRDLPQPKAHRNPITGMKITADGLQLLSLDTEGNVKLWDGPTFTPSLRFKPRKFNGNLLLRACGMDFACHSSFPEDRLAFIPDEANIEVLRLSDGQHLKSLSGHYAVASGCVYRAPYQELYSAGFDQSILAWTPRSDFACFLNETRSIEKLDWSSSEDETEAETS